MDYLFNKDDVTIHNSALALLVGSNRVGNSSRRKGSPGVGVPGYYIVGDTSHPGAGGGGQLGPRQNGG